MRDQFLILLQQLRDELAAADDISEPRRQQLLVLVDQMEKPPINMADQSFPDQLEQLVAEFEVSQPATAAVIKKVLETLQNIGI